MPFEKISRTFAEALQRLVSGETLNASAFGNKHQLKKLVEDRAVVRMITGRNRAQIYCPDSEALRNVLRLHFGITHLETYIESFGQNSRDGEDSLRATSSTKTLRSKSLQGFFIKTFDSLLTLGSQPLISLPHGVDYFISDFEALQVSETATVVGVENPECFTKMSRLRHLFPADSIFVMRYHSSSPAKWLQTISNSYLHFGDFDPAGIAIYCNEYLKHLNPARSTFFIPSNIEEIIKNGQVELYDNQRQYLPALKDVLQKSLRELIHLVEKHGKGAEQERLLLDANAWNRPSPNLFHLYNRAIAGG